MNLDKVNAILVLEDGSFHSFGEKKMLPPSELGEDNYHDSSFMKSVYPTAWFQATGYPFRVKDGFSRQMQELAGFGITVLCNASYAMPGFDDYYCYIIDVPVKISEEVRSYLANVYPYLKSNIEEHQAYFQGCAFLPNGDYAWHGDVFDIDEFYQKLNIPVVENVRCLYGEY